MTASVGSMKFQLKTKRVKRFSMTEYLGLGRMLIVSWDFVRIICLSAVIGCLGESLSSFVTDVAKDKYYADFMPMFQITL